MLDQDIATAERGLDAHLPWWRTMNDARQDVIVNMVFNLGIEGFLAFHHTIAAEEADNYALAAADMLVTKPWCVQVGARAQRLATQMRTGARAGAVAPVDPIAAI